MNATAAPKPAPEESDWQSTKTPNLVRYKPSGTYYARVRVAGKLHVKSLKTDVFSVAEQRLRDFVSKRVKLAKGVKRVSNGKMTFGDALRIYQAQVAADVSLKPRAKEYREETIDFLLRNWTGLKEIDISKIHESDCREWATPFAAKYSSSVYNNTLGTLRAVFNVAIKQGAIFENPAAELKKKKVRQKRLELPSRDVFPVLVKSVREAGGRFSKDCADFIEFLAFGGMRKGEAVRVTGADCDFEKQRVRVLGDPVHGTKNWEVRSVPMIPEMLGLLLRIKSERPADTWLTAPLVRVRECQKAIDSAVKRLANPNKTNPPVFCPRFTHHDLRHLFATRCIESGVDIPTVSKWLGHKDGGALAMKTYGHLRDEHSTDMAAKVSFGMNGGAK